MNVWKACLFIAGFGLATQVGVKGETHLPLQDISPDKTDVVLSEREAFSDQFVIQKQRRMLAMEGNEVARRSIQADLSSSDLRIRHGAFLDAEEVGGEDMIVAVAEQLYNESPGGRPIDIDGSLISDVSVPASRHDAVIALSRMVDDPSAPKIDLQKITYDERNVIAWREWWAANRHRFSSEVAGN